MDHSLMKQLWVVRLTMLALVMLMIAGDHTTAQMAFAPNNGYMRRMLRMRLPINNAELMQNASATGFNPATHHTGYLVITTRVGLAPTRRPGSRPAIYGMKTNYFFTTQYRTVAPGAGKLSGSAPTNITINIGTTNTNNLYATYNFPVQIPVTSRGSTVFAGGNNIYVGPLRQTPYSPFQSFVSRISSSGGGGTGPGGGGGTGPGGGGGTGPGGGGGTGPGGGGGTGPGGGGGTGPGGGGGVGPPGPRMSAPAPER